MSKKQSVTATSAAAAEICAAHLAFVEGSWPIITLLAILGNDTGDWSLLFDNTTAEGHCRKKPSESNGMLSKAFDYRNGYLKDMMDLKMYKVGHVPTDINKADMGTKTPKSEYQQRVWRSLAGLQLPRTAELAARKEAWRWTFSDEAPPKEPKEPHRYRLEQQELTKAKPIMNMTSAAPAVAAYSQVGTQYYNIAPDRTGDIDGVDEDSSAQLEDLYDFLDRGK